MSTLPAARREGLVVQELSTEVLVYDLTNDKAHCLNETSAFIWKQCDGQTTLAEAQSRLERHFANPVDEQMIWLALDQLAKFDLLESRVRRPAGMASLSRRALMQRMGMAAIITVPLITSIVAPPVHAQASCVSPGGPCNGNGNCCSKTCDPTGKCQ